MMSNLPKVLFIDDTYDDTIKGAVAAIVQMGIPVQFWNGKGDFPKGISNVRIAVIDLDLAGIGLRSGTEADYFPAVEALHKIPGPSLVIIMAKDFIDDDPSSLRSYYEKSYQSPFHGLIMEKGLTKYEELEDPSKLPKLLADSIENDKILSLLLTWETVIDKAQDKAFSQLVAKEMGTTIRYLIRSLCRDFGNESAAHELVSTIAQLILRRMYEPEEFKTLDVLVKKINSECVEANDDYPCKEDLLLYNKLMFYEPSADEPVWTGDIFRTEGLPKYYQYAIVLTPVCDLINRKTARVLLCFGFPIIEEAFADPEYPPYKIDSEIINRVENGEKPDEIVACMKKRYLGKGKLAENFYTLWNFLVEDEVLGLCFDFNRVMSMNIEGVKKWKRLQRLDFPFRQHILEVYGRFISRVGVPETNKNPEQLREKLKEHVKKSATATESIKTNTK